MAVPPPSPSPLGRRGSRGRGPFPGVPGPGPCQGHHRPVPPWLDLARPRRAPRLLFRRRWHWPHAACGEGVRPLMDGCLRAVRPPQASTAVWRPGQSGSSPRAAAAPGHIRAALRSAYQVALYPVSGARDRCHANSLANRMLQQQAVGRFPGVMLLASMTPATHGSTGHARLELWPSMAPTPQKTREPHTWTDFPGAFGPAGHWQRTEPLFDATVLWGRRKEVWGGSG